MALRLRAVSDGLEIGHQVGWDRAATEDVRRAKGGENGRIATSLPDAVQVGQAGRDPERCLVAARYNKSAVVAVRFHLIDDDLGGSVPALEAVAHANIALGRAVADHGNAKGKGHASALPDACCCSQHCVHVQDVCGVIGRPANDGDARRIGFQPVIDRTQAVPQRRQVQCPLGPIQQASNGDRFVGFALDVFAIGVGAVLDNDRHVRSLSDRPVASCAVCPVPARPALTSLPGDSSAAGDRVRSLRGGHAPG